MSGSLPDRPSLTQLRKIVRELRRAHGAGNREACRRIREHHPNHAERSDDEILAAPLAQRTAQLVVAREHGFDSWKALRTHVELLESGRTRRVYREPEERRVERELFDELISACREGRVDPVRSILRKAPDLVNRTLDYRPPLHLAVLGGHANLVAFLLRHGADPTHVEETWAGDSSMTVARNRGYGEIERMLHEAGSRRGPRVETALHGAVAAADRALTESLLDGGAEIDAIREDGFRPIHVALYRNNFWTRNLERDLVPYLASRGAEYTISVAAAMDDAERVKELLAQDRSLANHPDTCLKRPLSCAAENGNLPLLELLLEHGADPNLPEQMCRDDSFALWAAVHNGHDDCARLLLERGANPNADVDSGGPVYARCRDDRMRRLILSYGGRVNITSHVVYEDVETVERLLEQDPSLADDALHVQDAGPKHEENYLRMFRAAFAYGADPEACQVWSIHRALIGMPAVAELLFDNGVSPNRVVHRVAREGDIESMKLLLRRGASLEAREPQYRGTPLTVAARAGKVEMVRFLLSNGARPRYRGDEDWSTPLFWAEREGHAEIAELLREVTDRG